MEYVLMLLVIAIALVFTILIILIRLENKIHDIHDTLHSIDDGIWKR